MLQRKRAQADITPMIHIIIIIMHYREMVTPNSEHASQLKNLPPESSRDIHRGAVTCQDMELNGVSPVLCIK